MYIIEQLFAEGEVNIVEYLTILTEPEMNNCFSIFTRSDLNTESERKPLKNDKFDSGAPNENIVQNHLNKALLNVF